MVTWVISRAMRSSDFAVAELGEVLHLLPPIARFLAQILAGQVAAAVGARRLRRLGGARKGFFFAGEFFVESAHLAEELEGFLGAFLVDFGERKPNVDNRIVADFDLGYIVEADAF